MPVEQSKRASSRQLLAAIWCGPQILWAGQPLSNPGAYSGLKVKKQRMNFQEPEYLLNEPWWVTVMGCVMVAAMFVFALIAV